MKPLFISLLVLFAASTMYAEINIKQHNKLLELENKFQQALSLLDQDSIKAKKLFLETAHGYSGYIRLNNICSAGLLYNTGNAYYMAGDYGNAILNYRQGLDIDPGNKDLQFNLESARTARIDNFNRSSKITLTKVLMFWHFYLQKNTKFFLAIFLFIVLFTLSILKFLGKTTMSSWLLLPILFLSLLFSGSFLIEDQADQNNIEGVIISSEVTLRKGDNKSYEPVIEGQIHNGTEFVLVKQRKGWVYIKISGIDKGWVEEKDVAFMNYEL